MYLYVNPPRPGTAGLEDAEVRMALAGFRRLLVPVCWLSRNILA